MPQAARKNTNTLVDGMLNMTVVQKDIREFKYLAMNVVFLNLHTPVFTQEERDRPSDQAMLVDGLGKLALMARDVPAKNAVDNLFVMLDVYDEYKIKSHPIISDIMGNVRDICDSSVEPAALNAVAENMASYATHEKANKDHFGDFGLIVAGVCKRTDVTSDIQEKFGETLQALGVRPAKPSDKGPDFLCL